MLGGGGGSSREVGFPDLFCQVLVSASEGSDYSQSVPLNRFVMVCVKQMSQELLFSLTQVAFHSVTNLAPVILR